MEGNGQHSKLISDIPEVDYAISMGCNVGCSIYLWIYGKRDRRWKINIVDWSEFIRRTPFPLSK